MSVPLAISRATSGIKRLASPTSRLPDLLDDDDDVKLTLVDSEYSMKRNAIQ